MFRQMSDERHCMGCRLHRWQIHAVTQAEGASSVKQFKSETWNLVLVGFFFLSMIYLELINCCFIEEERKEGSIVRVGKAGRIKE